MVRKRSVVKLIAALLVAAVPKAESTDVLSLSFTDALF